MKCFFFFFSGELKCVIAEDRSAVYQPTIKHIKTLQVLYVGSHRKQWCGRYDVSHTLPVCVTFSFMKCISTHAFPMKSSSFV